MTDQSIERSLPRHMPAETERLRLLTEQALGVLDPLAVGNKAAEGVAAYIAAAEHIESTVASIKRMAAEIEEVGNTLSADLRRRGAAMDRMVESFAKLAAGTKQRMQDEKKMLEEIAKGDS